MSKPISVFNDLFLRLTLQFGARTSLSRFWKNCVGGMIAICISGFINFLLLELLSARRDLQFLLLFTGLPLLISLAWAFYLLTVASISRLHDINLSGWWLLLHLVPAAGSPIVFFMLLLIPGTRGKNDFGSEPEFF